ncbi:hypothetical protein CR513_24205, partial [Mucuna pruriens]
MPSKACREDERIHPSWSVIFLNLDLRSSIDQASLRHHAPPNNGMRTSAVSAFVEAGLNVRCRSGSFGSKSGPTRSHNKHAFIPRIKLFNQSMEVLLPLSKVNKQHRNLKSNQKMIELLTRHMLSISQVSNNDSASKARGHNPKGHWYSRGKRGDAEWKDLCSRRLVRQRPHSRKAMQGSRGAKEGGDEG